jgi:hypothetical protein
MYFLPEELLFSYLMFEHYSNTTTPNQSYPKHWIGGVQHPPGPNKNIAILLCYEH